MKFAYRTASFRNRSLDEALKVIAQSGYEGVEICLEYHELRVLAVEKAFRSLRLNSSAAGLEISSLSDHSNLLDSEAFEQVRVGLEQAGETGAAVFIVASAPKATGSWPVLTERLGELLDIARANQMRLAIEPEPDLMVEGSAEFEKLKGDLGGGSFLAMNLDIGHAWCMREPLNEIVSRLHEDIAHFHIEDIAGRVHRHLMPGDGDIDFRSSLASIARWCPGRFLCVDLFNIQDPASAAEALRFLRQRVSEITR